MKMTILAVAISCAVASTANAASWEKQEGVTDSTITTEVTLTNKYTNIGSNLTLANGGKLTVGSGYSIGVDSTQADFGNVPNAMSMVGGTLTVNGGVQVNDFRLDGGDVTVENKESSDWNRNASVGGYNTFEMTGGTLTVKEGGRVWIGSGNGALPADMVFSGGRLVLDGTETNQAIVTTMTMGSFMKPDGTRYDQKMVLSGTQVDVAGYGLMMSRDLIVEGSTINVADGAHLTILSEKELSNQGNGTPNTSSTSETFNDGEFTLESGSIHLGKGATLTGRTTAVVNGGSIATTDLRIGGVEATAKGEGNAIAFQNMEIYGGSVSADTVTVHTGSSLTYNTQSNALHAGKVVASGNIEFTGVTAADNGKTAASLLGVADDQFTNNNTTGENLAITSNIVNATFADGKLAVEMKDKETVMNGTGLASSAYADTIYSVYGSTSDLSDDMTAYALLQAGFALEDETVGSASAATIAEEYDDIIETASARGLAAYTVAADVQRLINDGVEARNMSSIHQGGGVWANVFYSQNSADSLYGDNAGYETDIYGGQLGVDWTASCGYRLGAVLTVGTADSNNTGEFTDTNIDSDFYGFSIYASKQVERLTFGVDVGYTKVENDLTTHAFGKKFDDSVDANVWTAGLRANILAWDGDVLKVTPHVGLRYNYIDMDDMGITDQDGLNLLEMPAGVTFSGNFEAAGWTVAPVLDLSIVPQIGDKEVDIAVRGANGTNFDVIDGSLFRTTLGVRAEYGNFGLGLNYKYGTSSEDRDDHSVNVNAVYRF